MNVVRSGFGEAILDFAVFDKYSKRPLIVSAFSPSYANMNALVASVMMRSQIAIGFQGCPKDYSDKNVLFEGSLTRIDMGYESFTQGVMVLKNFTDSYLLVNAEEDLLKKVFYDYLMNHYDLPLLERWTEYILRKALQCGVVRQCIEVKQNPVLSYGGTSSLELYRKSIPLNELRLYRCDITIEWLESVVCKGLANGEIYITRTKQQPLLFADMDTYFQNYGTSIVENQQKKITPRMNLKGRVDEMAFIKTRLFPQQAALVNGIVKLFSDGEKYCITNGGMGVGKTKITLGDIEAYFVAKYLKEHPGITLEQVYRDNLVSYRVIAMMPGHLVQKWRAEAVNDISDVRVEIIESLSQLVELEKRGKARTGKEFYIIGKDLCKLSYSFKPVPYQVKKLPRVRLICKDCRQEADYADFREKKPCAKCNGEIIKVRTRSVEKGLACPSCGELIILEKDEIAKPVDFAVKKDVNDKCKLCGECLWTANVQTLDNTSSLSPKPKRWYKISHYTNKTRKSKTTSWVLKGYEDSFLESKGLDNNDYTDGREQLTRKIAPASYIKKRLKGFFDMAVFDECHLYKGGDTAQGNAMHALVKSSDFQLLLTGTLFGGMANHIFYLLYRVNPRKMKEMGFNYSDEMEFVRRYGTMETRYEVPEGYSVHNSCSKGRKISSPSPRPGISPLIFPEMLIKNTVLLDISDLSRYLPPLIEQVIAVEMDGDVRDEYNSVIDTLRRCGNGLKNVMGPAMIQFSLSYPDKPYGYGDIINPKTGGIVVTPNEFDYIGELLPKEEKLIDIINQEQARGRNVFVYCEYTGSGPQQITLRLKDIIERNCNLFGAVTILEASSPKPSEREEWIHKKASEGTRVFICNPRVVETGLDFIFTYNDVVYNYPTIIFFQMSWSLFTLWQASRRHYRLNQTEECLTYYLCYKNTTQEKMVELMASKIVATSAIQGGKFSSEGLQAMARGVDARVKLLQAMIDNSLDDDSTESIRNMFDVINSANNNSAADMADEYGNILYHELLGYEAVVKETTTLDAEINIDFEKTNSFDYFAFTEVVMPTIEEVTAEIGLEVILEPYQAPLKRKRKDVMEGQTFLFSC